MNRTEVKTINDLPELPFEKVLSYLSLEDRLKSRAVSRRWYNMINIFKVKTLCYSDRPAGFIWGRRRLISGAFDQNFINSTRFSSFFDTFSSTTLSNLKHLRLLDLTVEPTLRASFLQTLHSFAQLERLDLIRFCQVTSDKKLELDLPMLKSVEFKQIGGVDTLTLNAPRLKAIKFWCCEPEMKLDIVHVESIESLTIDRAEHIHPDATGRLTKFKNLKYLCTGTYPAVEGEFLKHLEQLKEFHSCDFNDMASLFKQKLRYGRTDLKVSCWGLFLNGPDDRRSGGFAYWANDLSRLADEIPFYSILNYREIETAAPEPALNVVRRFSNLLTITVDRPVQDIQRFLDVLSHSEHLVQLRFECDQPQKLFDRLPEHCAVQVLYISAASDFQFLSRLKHLTKLDLECSIYARTIRSVLKELEFLTSFRFEYNNKLAIMNIHRGSFTVYFDGKTTHHASQKDAIQAVVAKRSK